MPNFTSTKEKHDRKRRISRNYKCYFLKDISSDLNEETIPKIEQDLLSIDDNIFDIFERKCKSEILLIRNDSVEEFVSYASKANLTLDGRISDSIFKMNPFLFENKGILKNTWHSSA